MKLLVKWSMLSHELCSSVYMGCENHVELPVCPLSLGLFKGNAMLHFLCVCVCEK